MRVLFPLAHSNTPPVLLLLLLLLLLFVLLLFVLVIAGLTATRSPRHRACVSALELAHYEQMQRMERLRRMHAQLRRNPFGLRRVHDEEECEE